VNEDGKPFFDPIDFDDLEVKNGNEIKRFSDTIMGN